MSQSTPRRSLGPNSRRGPQKAHIPFRGDDLEHGKKTGKIVTHVSRDADDFEPFEQVLNQAYRSGNVPRPANNRSKAVNGRSRRELSPVPDDDAGSGELSMDIDSTHSSPSVYFNTATAPQPSSAKRVGSSLRPLPRGSTVDYDRVPSPSSIRRQSSIRLNPRPLHPSRLREEVQNDQEGPFINDHQEETDYPGNNGFPNDPSPHSRDNLSFTALAQDEDDHFIEDDRLPNVQRAGKGKGRANVRQDSGDEEDAGIEDDIAADLQEVEDIYDQEEEYEPGPSKKKFRGTQNKSSHHPESPNKRSNRPQARIKEQHRVSIYETLDENGLRRSKRLHYPPLEYWRQEKVVWGRRQNGRSVVPVIKEIITIPKPPPEPLGAKKRKRGGTRALGGRSKSLATPNPPAEEVRVVEVDNPELGWDDDTNSQGIIIDWHTEQEVERRVAFTSNMAVAPTEAQGGTYGFQKIFGDDNFVASGLIEIPPGGVKPAKPAKDNTFIFYVIQGAVQCKVHRASFILATGGMFMVPRGNQYFIRNICERHVKLFFAQARKVPEALMQVAPDVLPRTTAPSPARTTPRSSLPGAPSREQHEAPSRDVGRARSKNI